jgi:predicted kinase
MNGSLILLRGLPGSGKSALARVLSDDFNHPVYSIDSFFTDPVTGKYSFDYLKNHVAYRHCEQQAGQSMEQGAEKIFVDNTFTLEWEIEPYFKLAARHNYRVFVVTVENRHGGKNCHGISDDQLKKMAEKYKVQLM